MLTRYNIFSFWVYYLLVLIIALNPLAKQKFSTDLMFVSAHFTLDLYNVYFI